MTYLFHPDCGHETLRLEAEAFRYIIKVRRHRIDDTIALRTPDHDGCLYLYRIVTIDGRRAHLELTSSKSLQIASDRSLHLAWCMIDPKIVEKTLPMLNEIGVNALTFLRCARSQKPFEPDFDRLDRILTNSMQQSGRSQKMVLRLGDTPQSFIAEHPETVIFDFNGSELKNDEKINTALVGCEGGFTDQERHDFAKAHTVKFSTPMILRSETAAVAIASKILL